MDAQFNEYLAAVAGMRDTYGEAGDIRAIRHHDDSVPSTTEGDEIEAEAGSHWDV